MAAALRIDSIHGSIEAEQKWVSPRAQQKLRSSVSREQLEAPFLRQVSQQRSACSPLSRAGSGLKPVSSVHLVELNVREAILYDVMMMMMVETSKR